jgi:arsenate reductase (glutaredoxin)
MPEYVIYHNPRCSKSRATLKLLQENAIDPKVRLYLDNPPNPKELKAVLKALGISARELLRDGEDEYQALNLADPKKSDTALIRAMIEHPRLIQRPIVIRDQTNAALGRPPENILPLID